MWQRTATCPRRSGDARSAQTTSRRIHRKQDADRVLAHPVYCCSCVGGCSSTLEPQRRGQGGLLTIGIEGHCTGYADGQWDEIDNCSCCSAQKNRASGITFSTTLMPMQNQSTCPRPSS